ncbi:hypothetical protein [Amycolatopsis saalfeldensis]|uniref:hypothetical protein n=1 Tax=Amycolatopsis saalfeldensis TaxID=394193 RepID=UPI001FE3ACD7|nr:hypothetical protein [Amycolatopsis saalfeldensis]
MPVLVIRSEASSLEQTASKNRAQCNSIGAGRAPVTGNGSLRMPTIGPLNNRRPRARSERTCGAVALSFGGSR